MSISVYEKIPNSLKKLNFTELEYKAFSKLHWVVTEKVHGANFSLFYQDSKLHYAKRKAELSWDDDFFAFQLVIQKIENNILSLFENLSMEYEAEKYIIYGELFGGEYPHPEVQADPKVKPIQTGIYYSPTINFYAFDMAMEYNNSSKKYIPYKEASALFQKFNIFHAQPLFTGKMNDAFDFNIRINSTIPYSLGLPELKNNLIEGIVVKPYDSTDNLDRRPILKIKNPEFDEEDKFHDAVAWSYKPEGTTNEMDLSFIMDELKNYITINRIQSAVSKIGQLNSEKPERENDIFNESLEDIITDFNENNANMFSELEKDQQLWLTERISAEIKKLIHKYASNEKE